MKKLLATLFTTLMLSVGLLAGGAAPASATPSQSSAVSLAGPIQLEQAATSGLQAKACSFKVKWVPARWTPACINWYPGKYLVPAYCKGRYVPLPC